MHAREAVRFDLLGKSAIFKKPDVNTTYFTYNNIHRVALLGLLGAVLGLKGHTGSDKNARYPEFYEKLKDLDLCIIPRGPKGYFPKKIQVFNNSVGYASFEEGGNLVIKEQWLENPKWTIYVSDGNGSAAEVYEQLKNMLLKGETVFTPYLGKNEHPAVIENCKVAELVKSEEDYVNCLFPADMGTLDKVNTWNGKRLGFIFREMAPYTMKENQHFYEFREFVYTNYRFSQIEEGKNIYTDGEFHIMFY